MKSSNKQFDQIIKEKLHSLEFSTQLADQELLMKKLHSKDFSTKKYTGLKFLMVLALLSSFAFIQLQQQKGTAHYFQVQEISKDAPLLAKFINEAPVFQTPRTAVAQVNGNQLQQLVAHFQTPQQRANTTTPIEKLQHLPKYPQVRSTLTGLNRIQAPAIDQFVKYNGKPLQEAQTSVQKTLVCGQSEDGSKLIVAQSKVAKFKADSTLANDDFGVYRPAGLQEDAVIQYAVYDKKTLFRRFQFEHIHHGIRTTKIAKPQRAEKVKTEKNKAPAAFHSSYMAPNPHVHHTRQYLESEYEEYTYFIQNDSILFISDRVNFVVVMTPQGDILSKAQISISEPYMYYLGEKTTFFDQASGKVYLSVSTLYRINLYELDPSNGQTTFLTALDDVWPNPNFKVTNGVLHYQKGSKLFEQRLTK